MSVVARASVFDDLSGTEIRKPALLPVAVQEPAIRTARIMRSAVLFLMPTIHG
ncbi:hypothetical protein [Chlorobium sp.]|uniref:hypothetical protein n=1 Tax=Chlorobium sp. TaxID=1095 RepID=UPI003C5F78FC